MREARESRNNEYMNVMWCQTHIQKKDDGWHIVWPNGNDADSIVFVTSEKALKHRKKKIMENLK